MFWHVIAAECRWLIYLPEKNVAYAFFVPQLLSLYCLSCGEVTPAPFLQGLPSSIMNISEGLTVLLVFSWGCGHSVVDDNCGGTSQPGCWVVPKADGLRKNVLISDYAQMRALGLSPCAGGFVLLVAGSSFGLGWLPGSTFSSLEFIKP